MAKVDDVAAYLLTALGEMPAMKFQKLAYYSQAWHVVWEGKPLYSAPIQAWANGPVVPKLYKGHRRQYWIGEWPVGDAGNLTPEESSTIDAIVEHYGDKNASWLSALTHSEKPWQDARKGLAPGERGVVEITTSAMFDYYSQL